MSPRRTAAEARALLRRLLEEGATIWTMHAKQELAKDALAMPDAVNVMRGGTVVITFDGEDDEEEPTEIVVITAWREQRR